MQESRWRFLSALFIVFLSASFFTRIFLLATVWDSISHHFFVLSRIVIVGFVYDIITGLYAFSLLVGYLFLVPCRVYETYIHRIFLFFISFFIIFGIFFSSISEYLFWEEFGKRFNFIAVDYLVYTFEVTKNIEESYPLPLIFSLIFIATAIVVYIIRRRIFTLPLKNSFKKRISFVISFWMLSLTSFIFIDGQKLAHFSSNVYIGELSKNGIYSLFSAFRHNQLDYPVFYKTLNTKEIMNYLYELENFSEEKSKKFFSRHSEKHYNVITIMVESLSASYMGIYGDDRGWTPHLDALAKESLFFNNLYATGTRTVRGMEAVVLSVPPTPGRSIVKRPKNSNMDSVGSIFAAKGYQNKFIYAGYGYFDNMNNFFTNNGFEAIDRTDFAKDEISFANVWGACDEDLFNKTIKEADKSFGEGKPFFSFVMTTSNHRPYTYPDNKIDIPSHTGRKGGVMYTDFAINKFITDAKKKPWFDNTIFIVIADHNGGSAGKKSLPLYRYKIPLLFYAPQIIKPSVVTKLSSQIDTMPTLLSLMGFEYESRFYGNNILSEEYEERAFIGNYQKLGYYQRDFLYYLTPDKKSHKKYVENLSLYDVSYKNAEISKHEEKSIVTYYQSASYLYNKLP